MVTAWAKESSCSGRKRPSPTPAIRGVPGEGAAPSSEEEPPELDPEPGSTMVEAARLMYPLAQWLEGTSVKMVRVEWRTTWSPSPMKLTAMVQN